MKIAVTGGAGFIGSNLVRALSAAPPVTQVVVVDDLSTGARDNVAGPARFVEGTILSDDHLDEAFAGAASVVHLAAIPSVPRSVLDPLASHEANATGTVKVLEAARRHDVGQVILASSSSVYGANPELPKHEGMRPMPLSPYAVSKLATEAYAPAYSSCYGLPVLPFRFFNVFGPGQPADHAYAAVVPGVRLGRAGRPAAAGLRGRPAGTRDFTFVGRVGAVIVDAVLRRVSTTDPVNLAFGSRISLLELIAELEDVFGRRLDVMHETAPARGRP